MDLPSLRAFLTVADEGYVTRAASKLHLTQPAVSAQLAKLEAAVDQRLFHRTPRGMVLTEAGHVLRPHAEAVLARVSDSEEALRRFAGLETGELRVGGGATATTYLLPPALGTFHTEHPGIRLHVREQGSAAVWRALAAGTLDIGVVTAPTLGAQIVDRRLDDAVQLEPWLDDELVLLLPPGHALDGQAAFRWRDLHGERLVLFEGGTAVRGIIDRHAAAAGVTIAPAMELRSIESIKQMVAQGIGAGFVSRFALPEVAKLAPTSPVTQHAHHGARPSGLRCADGVLARRLALATRADRPPSPAASAFRALLRDTVPAAVSAGWPPRADAAGAA